MFGVVCGNMTQDIHIIVGWDKEILDLLPMINTEFLISKEIYTNGNGVAEAITEFIGHEFCKIEIGSKTVYGFRLELIGYFDVYSVKDMADILAEAQFIATQSFPFWSQIFDVATANKMSVNEPNIYFRYY